MRQNARFLSFSALGVEPSSAGQHRAAVPKWLFSGSLGRVLLARIISAAGADHELAVSLGAGFDADGAIAAGALRGRGLISDGVLVADVVGHGAADLVHFVEGSGKERDASGSLGNGFKCAAGTARFLFSE